MRSAMKDKKLGLILVCVFLFSSVTPVLSTVKERIGRGSIYVLGGMLQRGLSKECFERRKGDEAFEEIDGESNSLCPELLDEFVGLLVAVTIESVASIGLDYFSDSDRQNLGKKRVISNIASGLGGVVSRPLTRLCGLKPGDPRDLLITAGLSGGAAILVDLGLEKYYSPERPEQSKSKNDPIEDLKKRNEEKRRDREEKQRRDQQKKPNPVVRDLRQRQQKKKEKVDKTIPQQRLVQSTIVRQERQQKQQDKTPEPQYSEPRHWYQRGFNK